MNDIHRSVALVGLPFVLVPVELADSRECWSLFHVPCMMATGNDPGWWQSQDGINDVNRWWHRLTAEQRFAFRGTNINEMKAAGCARALDDLVEASDFRIVNGDEP